MLRPTAALLVVFASPAFAQAVYRWVDAEGTTHYTDNSAAIPQGVEVFATEGEPISEMGKPGPVPQKPATVVADPKQVEAGPAIPTSSEQYWRNQFRMMREQIKQLEDEIAADRYRTEDVNGLPVGPTYSCFPTGYYARPRQGAQVQVGPSGAQAYFGPIGQGGFVNYNTCFQAVNPEYDRAKVRLEKNRKALERAKEDLHDLERRAAFEAVPLEWRR